MSQGWIVALKIAGQCVASVIAGFFLMWPLSIVSDALHLANFNTWAMVHGGFGVAWPMLAIFSFGLLGCVKWFFRFHDAPLLAAGAMFGLWPQGLMGAPEPPNFLMFSPGVIVVAGLGAAILCAAARRPLLLALVIALPSLDVVWLLLGALFNPMGLEFIAVMASRSLVLPGTIIAGGILGALARRLWMRKAA